MTNKTVLEKNKSVLANVFNCGLAWVDERFPLTSNIKAHLTEYYAPKKFQFLVLLWLAISIGVGVANRNGHFLNHALQARC